MARYRIADLTVQMDVSERTKQQAKPYLIQQDGPVDSCLSLDCQRFLERYPQLKDLDTAQYIGTGAVFAAEVLAFYGFQFHASAVMLEGKVYLFSAPPGTGKSTHTGKWRRLFGAEIINDDKPVLRRMNGSWTVYGTPWSGKHDLSNPVSVPLGGIAFVKRGEQNRIYRISPAEAVPAMISQCIRFGHRDCMSRQLELIDLLLREAAVWQLFCRNDDEAAIVSCEAMKCDEGGK
ncbi:MAG: hypothetical protein E7435_02610 [Ruminococcaceae bacterium]|nr:hypothetical protein [Oscillospiraceae bacterium]